MIYYYLTIYQYYILLVSLNNQFIDSILFRQYFYRLVDIVNMVKKCVFLFSSLLFISDIRSRIELL